MSNALASETPKPRGWLSIKDLVKDQGIREFTDGCILLLYWAEKKGPDDGDIGQKIYFENRP